MNNDRIIVLENVSNQSVGLKDTQGRTYRLGVNAKIRISQVSLQDIFDYPASKVIFREGLAKVSNISADALYNMGLTEDEIKAYSTDAFELSPIQPYYEEVVEEEKEEEVKEEVKPKTTAKKTATTKKSTITKKSTSSKKKSA